MSKKDESYYEELLDKFLAGKHSEKELDELNSVAKENKEIQKQLALHIEARANIRAVGEKKLRQQLSESYSEMVEDGDHTNEAIIKSLPKKSKTGFRWIAAAAAVAGLILLSILWPSRTSNDSFAELLNDPPVITLRGQPTNEFTTIWKKGEEAYMNKNFKGALTYFGQLNQFPEEAQAHFGKITIYKGFIFAQLKQYDDAIKQFHSIPENNPLSDEALWYLTNTYLKIGDTVNAKNILSKIIRKPTHYKLSEAKKILESLR